METADLQEFGLTPIEATLFLHLVRKGPSTLTSISKETGLHRGTVYNSLQKLITKNFVVFTTTKKATIYSTNSKDIFTDILNREKESLNKKKDLAKSLMKEIKTLSEPKDINPKVHIGLGKDAYYTHFVEMFNICNQKKIEYCWIGDGIGNTSKYMGEHNYHKIINLKKKMKIKFRSIMNVGARPHKHKHYSPGARYLPKKYRFPTYTWIYDNRVVIVDLHADPIIVITIEDDDVFLTYKNQFELLYSIAK